MTGGAVQTVEAVLGQAEPSVQKAYDESNWDGSHGATDAVLAYGTEPGKRVGNGSETD
jgi:hypothetical protein